MRYIAIALNRKISREDHRPVRIMAGRFNKQRWLRFHYKFRKGMGSGFVGRIMYMMRYEK